MTAKNLSILCRASWESASFTVISRQKLFQNKLNFLLDVTIELRYYLVT